MTWTLDHIKQLAAAGKIRSYKIPETLKKYSQKQAKNIPPRKSKYGNKKCVVDDIEFDSIKEANRYKELKLLLKAGHIGHLQRQVPYELNEGGTHSLVYIADFVYIDTLTGETVVEDAKGFRTREFIKKRRLMKKVHGIIIQEK